MSPLTTSLCRRLGIELPIVQAPIGSAASPELVAAVCNAGGLGMLALTWTPVEQMLAELGRVRELTNRPFGVNFVLDFPIADGLALCLDQDVPLISTFWGDPGAVNARIHAAGAKHLHTVGSAAEARRAVEAGVDVIVAQGWEAGGHVCGQIATLPLVPAVVDAVAPTPVIAAGGIADGRGLAAVLALGATAAWMGTRFLVAEEAFTHGEYRRRVIEVSGEDAVHTLCFDGGWPRAAHRAIRNSTMAAWLAAGGPPAPNRPGEGDVLAIDAAGREQLRYGDRMPLPGMTGDLEAMALYTGQSAGTIHDVMPAAEIIRRTVAEAEAALAVARSDLQDSAQ